MNRKQFIVLLFVILQVSLFHTKAGNPDNSTPYKVPEILPPSPQASLLGRYGEIPVSLSNGLVDISIPLYEIKIGKQKIPISISYHGGGIKVNDQASSVGLGWVLNAGGVITRSVRGIPDEFSAGFLNIHLPAENNNYDRDVYAYHMIENGYDGESDLYYYNFNGKSGKIFLTARTDTSFCKAVFQPYQPYGVDFDGGDGFSIVDNEGTSYSFQDTETSWGDSHDLYPSSWYLSTMSSNHSDATFSYSISSNSLANTPQSCYVTRNNPEGCYGDPDNHNITNGTSLHHSQKQLDNISFTGGNVSFTYGNYGQFAGDGIKPLLKIEITANDGTKITYNFKYLQFSGVTTRLRLDALEKTDGISPSSIYHFEYNSDYLPASNSAGQDIWGYYNGSSASTILMWNLNTIIPTWDPSGRIPDEDAMKMAMLKRITYPTGGFTDFEFEAHRVSNQIAGGLRIHKQTDNDGKGHISTTEYDYQNAYYSNTGFEGNYSLLQLYARHSIAYSWVKCTDTFGDNYFLDYTKTFYNPFNYSSLGSSGSSVAYGQVSVIKSSSNVVLKSTHTFMQYADEVEGIQWGHTLDNSWKRTIETSRFDYKYNAGQFIPVHSAINTYTPYQYNNLRNISMMAQLSAFNSLGQIYWTSDGKMHNEKYVIDTYIYNHPVETMLLTQTTETDYTDLGNIEKTTTYSYDNKTHIQPTLISTTTSEGNTESTRKIYVGDMDNSNATIVALKNQNRITEPVQILQMKNGTVYNTIDYTYGLFNQNLQVELAKVSNHYPNLPNENRIFYNRYDINSNPVDISDAGGLHTCYLWGYNYSLPVAKIVGITYGKIDTICGSSLLSNIGNSFSPASYLNTLRSNLAGQNVMITTNTYQMLYGVSNTTDPKNVNVRYQYDSFGRLSTIFNHDNQILSQFNYNYHIPSLFYNSEVGGGFYKNDCGTGYSGSYVYYMVPAHKHASTISQSDANQLAYTEVNTNGQAYANANGTCTAIQCTGDDRKMVNGVCEIGVKVYTKSMYWGGDPEQYQCVYHYEWSDGSWSTNYSEMSYEDCVNM